MKYIKLFEKSSEYDNFVNGNDFLLPNVSYVRENNYIGFHPYVPPPPALAGDIAYWSNGSVKTIPFSSWNTSLGTPVGVVVIPTGFAPDGKIRIVSLKYVDSNGNPSNVGVSMKWGSTSIDTSLINYDRVPTTDNAGSTSTGSASAGFLPSDKFTIGPNPCIQSYVDPEAIYGLMAATSSLLIPSPYLGDAPNPEYHKTISGYNNAFSDFNGLTNTQTLVGLGTDYEAANACWKYSDGVSNLQWYLPGMGELGYIMPRFNLINTSITAVGGVAVDDYDSLWSSSEGSSETVCYLSTYHGMVNSDTKDYQYFVRPFTTI